MGFFGNLDAAHAVLLAQLTPDACPVDVSPKELWTEGEMPALKTGLKMAPEKRFDGVDAVRRLRVRSAHRSTVPKHD